MYSKFKNLRQRLNLENLAMTDFCNAEVMDVIGFGGFLAINSTLGNLYSDETCRNIWRDNLGKSFKIVILHPSFMANQLNTSAYSCLMSYLRYKNLDLAGLSRSTKICSSIYSTTCCRYMKSAFAETTGRVLNASADSEQMFFLSRG